MKNGFTLIEILVALLVGSIVVLAAHALLAGVIDAGIGLRRDALPQAEGILARAWLQEACRTLEAGTPGAGGFEGNGTSATFAARLMTNDGWVERTKVALVVQDGGLELRFAGRALAPVARRSNAHLDYLVDGGGEGGWVTGWSSPVSAPVAIRIQSTGASGADTLLCPIGARG